MNAGSSENDRIEAVAASILRYLRQRPNAADTVEGIHRWWVEWDDRDPPQALTHRALLLLQSRGSVEQVDMASRKIWRAARPASPSLTP